MSCYLMNARNQAESTGLSRFPPPRVQCCSVSPPRAGRVFEWAIMQSIVRDDPWHHIDQLCIRALTSARAFAAATWGRRPRARRRRPRSLNILTACEPMCLSSRHQMILLASYRTALTWESKNPSRIGREIEIFSIFAWLIPTLVPKLNSRFWVFLRTICWSWQSMKHLVERKSQFLCGFLFLLLAQIQVLIWGRRFSSIVGFQSPNFAQSYWNRINRHFGFWEKKYHEMEFRPLGNDSYGIKGVISANMWYVRMKYVLILLV